VRRTRASASGFTMIEMLAVMLLIGILVSAVASFYIQLSRESNGAADATRTARRSVAALDRIARDLEGAVLVRKPDALDPLDHPWLFYAEQAGGGEGADRLRFTIRSHRPRAGARHESDLAVVAYGLREEPDGGLALVRWISPRLPEGLDRRVPLEEEDGAQVLVDGVLDFGVRFQSEEGDWRETWDSSSLDDSSQLPRVAEIHLALEEEGATLDETADREPVPVVRQAILPLRPLDLEILLTPAALRGDEDEEAEDEDEEADARSAEDDEGEQGCVTVAQCLAAHPELDAIAALEAAGLSAGSLGGMGRECASQFAAFFGLPGDCL